MMRIGFLKLTAAITIGVFAGTFCTAVLKDSVIDEASEALDDLLFPSAGECRVGTFERRFEMVPLCPKCGDRLPRPDHPQVF